MKNLEKPRVRKWNRSGVQCEGSGISRIGYNIQDAYERWQYTLDNQRVTTGHCENKKRLGGCQLHNLQCGYPACDVMTGAAPVAVVHFVCDRIPDQTGCTFIECEDATGSSIDAGKWEVRPDGLAQLVVSRAPINLPEYKRPPPGCVITQEMAAHNACLDKVKEMNQ